MAIIQWLSMVALLIISPAAVASYSYDPQTRTLIVYGTPMSSQHLRQILRRCVTSVVAPTSQWNHHPIHHLALYAVDPKYILSLLYHPILEGVQIFELHQCNLINQGIPLLSLMRYANNQPNIHMSFLVEAKLSKIQHIIVSEKLLEKATFLDLFINKLEEDFQKTSSETRVTFYSVSDDKAQLTLLRDYTPYVPVDILSEDSISEEIIPEERTFFSRLWNCCKKRAPSKKRPSMMMEEER